jgi:tetratricopeptide (TPR) repeat protein
MLRPATLQEAVHAYKAALQVSPKSDAARLNLGLAYYKLALWSEAADAFLLYRKAHSDDLRTGVLLADCELQVGAYKRTIAVGEPLESSHPDDLALAYVLGTAYLHDNQEANGMRLVRKIMDRGDTSEVHLMLGDSYTLGGDYKAAVAEYTQALEKEPDQPLAHLRLAEAQTSLGDFDGAFPNFLYAQQHNPGNFEANYYLGYIYKERNQTGQAKSFLENAARLRPDLY